jgi:O-antigen ligase
MHTALRHSFDVNPAIMTAGAVMVVLFLVLIPLRPAIAAGLSLIGMPLMALLMYSLGLNVEHVVLIAANCTAIFGALVMFLKYRSVRVEGHGTVILFLLLTALVGVGVVRTPSTFSDQAWMKFELFLALGAVPFFLGRQCSRSDRLLRSVLDWVLIIGSAYVLVCLVVYAQGKVGKFGEGRFANLGDPIGIAQNCGITLVLCVAYLFESSWFRRGVLVLVATTAFFILLATASRGPLIATVVGGMAAILLYRRLSRKIAGVVVGTTALVMLFVLLAPGQALRRFGQSLSGESLSTVSNGRMGIYSLALNHVTDSPLLGLGTAGYSALEGSFKNLTYPHNMFIEVLIEWGLVGMAVFLLLLIIIGTRMIAFVRNHRHEPLLGRGYLAMMILVFLVAQTSQHLGLLSVFWFLCGIFSGRVTAPAEAANDLIGAGHYPEAYVETRDTAASY